MFNLARTALWYALKDIVHTEKPSILVPEYVCDVVIHPLIDLNFNIIYYTIDDFFEPIWINLEELLKDHKVDYFLLVHFFGQPTSLLNTLTFCEKHHIKLIEDNAHGFRGQLNNKLLGTFGFIGISSPRKNLEMSEGGVLYIMGKEFNGEITLKQSKTNIFQKLKKYLLNPKLFISIIRRRFFRTNTDYSNPLYSFENIQGYYSLNNEKINIIKNADWDALLNNSRERWETLLPILVTKYSLNPIWLKPFPDSNPWCLPMYCENLEHRNAILLHSEKNKLGFMSWPTLPKEVIFTKPLNLLRWNKLICIPLTNDKYVKNIINDTFK